MALLLVEDNRVMRTSLVRGLSEDGFELSAVENGRSALERLADGDVEAVILDLGLPDIDGTAILDFIRARKLMAPVLVLTARDTIAARVDALDRGADDVLVKPFRYTELLARVRAMMRRSAAPRWAPLSCNGLELENETHSVKLGGERITLSRHEHEVLELLLRRRGEAVSHKELAALFNDEVDDYTKNALHVHIGNLRRKLGSLHVLIEPIRTIGYRLRSAADVSGEHPLEVVAEPTASSSGSVRGTIAH